MKRLQSRRGRGFLVAVPLALLLGALGLRVAASPSSQEGSPDAAAGISGAADAPQIARASTATEASGAAGTTHVAALRGAPAAAAAAAAAATGADTTAALRPPSELAQLSYQREFFYYHGAGRRDPFKPLLEVDSAEGPRFDELVLTGLFVGENGEGMVVVEDAARKGYFLKPGDIVGKARLVEIHPDLAVFDVRDFGISRRETLKLQRPEETS